jgi:hypothetical protein
MPASPIGGAGVVSIDLMPLTAVVQGPQSRRRRRRGRPIAAALGCGHHVPGGPCLTVLPARWMKARVACQGRL